MNLGSWLRSVGREPLLLSADCSAADDGGVMPWLAMQEVTTRSIISASTDGERARDWRSKCTLDSWAASACSRLRLFRLCGRLARCIKLTRSMEGAPPAVAAFAHPGAEPRLNNMVSGSAAAAACPVEPTPPNEDALKLLPLWQRLGGRSPPVLSMDLAGLALTKLLFLLRSPAATAVAGRDLLLVSSSTILLDNLFNLGSGELSLDEDAAAAATATTAAVAAILLI